MCGQAFRWQSTGNDVCAYTGVVRGKVLRVRQEGECLILEGPTNEDSVAMTRDYFALDVDLGEIAVSYTHLDVYKRQMTVQSFLNRTAAGVLDPLFNLDVGFYLFDFPFHLIAYRLLIFLVGTTLVGSFILYVFSGSVRITGLWKGEGEGAAKFHLGFLAAAVLFLKAWGYRLQGLSLVYSKRGVVFGASFTDVHALLPGLRVLTVLALSLIHI